MNKKKALVLLNMGGARSKDELRVFLTNMFNDENILSIPVDLIRSMVAFFIVTTRLNKAWENYEQIGGKTPLHDLTDDLVKKLQDQYPDYFVTPAMRYTSPFAQTAVARIKQQGIKDVILLPLYPQFSTTTTKSSVEDFKEKANGQFNIKTVKPFYKNDTFNDAICNEIKRVQNKKDDYHLIFSAHGLPQKVINKGDPYQKQVEKHVQILKQKLDKFDNKFLSVNLAYQSKVGPLKWIEPSLDDMLENFKGKKVIVYPIAFIIDNSETVFELEIEYREMAEELKLQEFNVCKCVNDDQVFINAIGEFLDAKK